MTTVTAVIQARTGSSRLPGKVMYPLDGQTTLEHVVTRTAATDSVSDVVVATSIESQDDVIAEYAPEFGAEVVRGSESDVLSRFERAVRKYTPDIILRITGDCPLVDPATVDKVVAPVDQGEADYVSNISKRTFPRGLDVEAFTAESFDTVISAASTQIEHEHVTPHYREDSANFDVANITSDQVFGQERYTDRTDLRLTLDEADDYRLLEHIYHRIEYDDILPVRDAINLIDNGGLAELNESVRQKEVK